MSVTTKELAYFKELLGAEQLLVKKFTKYSEMCEDAELKAKLTDIASKHEGHYNKLLEQLR